VPVGGPGRRGGQQDRAEESEAAKRVLHVSSLDQLP
jgi:hypothetical protein